MLDPVLNVEMQEEMVLYHTHFRDAVHLIPGFKNFQELHLQARARSEHSTGRNEAAHITHRALAEWMGYASHTVVQRMAQGRRSVPETLAVWLQRRAADAPPRAE